VARDHRYTVDGTDYLRIVNWRRHQKIYHSTPGRLPARPIGTRQDSEEPREAFESESEKPSSDKALTPAAENPETFASLASRSERVGQNPCAAGLSPAFTSDSRGEGFFRQVAAAAQRVLARVG
jgi:hypothetical protein